MTVFSMRSKTLVMTPSMPGRRTSGFSPTRQTLLAPSAKGSEVVDESQGRDGGGGGGGGDGGGGKRPLLFKTKLAIQASYHTQPAKHEFGRNPLSCLFIFFVNRHKITTSAREIGTGGLTLFPSPSSRTTQHSSPSPNPGSPAALAIRLHSFQELRQPGVCFQHRLPCLPRLRTAHPQLRG